MSLFSWNGFIDTCDYLVQINDVVGKNIYRNNINNNTSLNLEKPLSLRNNKCDFNESTSSSIHKIVQESIFVCFCFLNLYYKNQINVIS